MSGLDQSDKGRPVAGTCVDRITSRIASAITV